MYRWSASSSSCYGSNGKTDDCPFLPSQPADHAFLLPSSSLPSAPSCYGLFQQQPLGPSCPQAQQVVPASPLIRRVVSTGDLVAPMGSRYSAEERRERIDKYRSKRNQRNFQKKITYACRKTLADSRPRVKGRFARNAGDAADAEEADLLQPELLTETGAPHPLQMDDDGAQHPGKATVMNPMTFPAGGSSGTTTAVPDWWPAMQEALAREEEEDHLCDADDEDLLAAYLGVSSINLCSYSPRGH